MKRDEIKKLADEDLMVLVERKDPVAFEILYDRHGGAAYSLAHRIVGRHGDRGAVGDQPVRLRAGAGVLSLVAGGVVVVVALAVSARRASGRAGRAAGRAPARDAPRAR